MNKRFALLAALLVIVFSLASAGIAEAKPAPTNDYQQFITGVHPRLNAAFQEGLRAGNHPEAFCKIGDSNTAFVRYLTRVGSPSMNLGEYADLQETVTYFSQNGNSFSRASWGAVSGFSTSMLTGFVDGYATCATLSWVQCEMAETSCMYAVVAIGTMDAWYGVSPDQYRADLLVLLGQITEHHTIPILFTLPRRCDQLDPATGTRTACFALIDAYNAVIRDVADELKIPLVDQHGALESLPMWGLHSDRIHMAQPPQGVAGTAIFDAVHLQYGSNVRNLLTLLVLDDLRETLVH